MKDEKRRRENGGKEEKLFVIFYSINRTKIKYHLERVVHLLLAAAFLAGLLAADFLADLLAAFWGVAWAEAVAGAA